MEADRLSENIVFYHGRCWRPVISNCGEGLPIRCIKRGSQIQHLHERVGGYRVLWDSMYYGFTMPTITEGPNYRPVLCYLMRTIISQNFYKISSCHWDAQFSIIWSAQFAEVHILAYQWLAFGNHMAHTKTTLTDNSIIVLVFEIAIIIRIQCGYVTESRGIILWEFSR